MPVRAAARPILFEGNVVSQSERVAILSRLLFLKNTLAVHCPKGIAHISANLSKTLEAPRTVGA